MIFKDSSVKCGLDDGFQPMVDCMGESATILAIGCRLATKCFRRADLETYVFWTYVQWMVDASIQISKLIGSRISKSNFFGNRLPAFRWWTTVTKFDQLLKPGSIQYFTPATKMWWDWKLASRKYCTTASKSVRIRIQRPYANLTPVPTFPYI